MDISAAKPAERIKKLASYSETVDVDPNIPPIRYYRSGSEMVRMANVYLEEGSLENAYVLYLKFMTLFIEKIRKHPDFATVPEHFRVKNSEQLREVFPKAEKLKALLVDLYTKQYNHFLEQQNQREYAEREKELRLKKEREAKEKDNIRLKSRKDPTIGNNILPIVQPVSIDDICYPDPSIDRPKPDVIQPKPHILPEFRPDIPSVPKPDISKLKVDNGDKSKPDIVEKPKPELVVSPVIKLDIPGSIPSAPSFDRGAKPTSLLSPSLTSKAFSLRTVVVPSRLLSSFINIAHRNTVNNIETCGILAGKLERDQLIITHMIIPKQKGTSDSCVTMNEEEIFDFQDQHNLITLGWIHTHPTQTAFLSSVDLHTHCSYQTMMPEAIAIVCAPKYDETGFFTLTPNHGLDFISRCRKTGFHPHPPDPPLFQSCDHTRVDHAAIIELVDLRA